MAGSYSITGTLQPVSAAGVSYIWGLVSGATVADGTLYLCDMTFDSASLAQGVLLELFTATGNIPTGTSLTINKESSDAQTSSGLASAWGTSGSSDMTGTQPPSGLYVRRSWYISPASGLLTQWSLSREVYLPAGTTTWTGMRVTAPTGVSPNLAWNAAWNE